MSGTFDAGALVWKIQTVGAEMFRRDQKDAQDAFLKTGDAATKSAKQVSEQGSSTDKAAASARNAKKPLDEQATATKKSADEAAKAEKAAREHAAALEEQRAAAQQLANAMMLAGTAAAAMVTLAVVKHTEFDQAMSNTSAAIMATREEQELLSESALQAGADTAYSATEAAAAQEELAKAGMEVTEVIGGGLNGALSLAAAGQLAVARSAEIMATTLTQFRLPAEQAAHVSDILAAGAGKAQGSVDELALALSYVGPIAGSVGFSLEETAGTIAYFATQGIVGEKAGTSLRGVLASLQAPSSLAEKEMKKYNLTMFDANGNMMSLSGIAEQLRTRLGGLTEQERLAALGRIFGNESLNAATLLYEGGADAVETWTDKVNDSGYAAEQAAMRQDNLAGDLEKLGGSFETVLIKQGEGANNVLRGLVQSMTGLVDIFGEAPEPVHAVALGLGATTAAALLTAGATVTVRNRLAELRTALDKTSISFNKTALVGAAAGVALTGVIAIVGALAMAHAEAEARAEAYAATLSETGEATEGTYEMIAKKMTEVQDGWDALFANRQMSGQDAVEKLGMNLSEVIKIAGDGGREFMTLTRNLSELRYNTDGAADALANELGISTEEVASAAYNLSVVLTDETALIRKGAKDAEELANALMGIKPANDEAAGSAGTAADKFLEQADATKAVEDRLRELVDALMESNNQAQDAESANARYQDALAGISEEIQSQRDAYEEANWTLDGFTASLDANTVIGSANRAMLAGVAGAAQIVAQKQYETDLTTMSANDAAQKYNETLEAQRAKLIEQAEAAGFSKIEVDELVASVFAIPPAKSLEILAETETAMNKINQFVIDASGKRINIRVDTHAGTVYSPQGTSLQYYKDGGHVEFYADGGHRSENHVAQMARGGAIRIWNEPETEGETYIPHAPAKRARSTQILAETADLFGFDLVPRTAQRFENGGASPAVTYADRVPEVRGGPQIVIVNPVVRDLVDEAWEAAQIADSMGSW